MNTDPKKSTKKDGKIKKAKIGEIPGLNQLKQRFKGKYTVDAIRNKINKYTLTDKSGGSSSYSPGAMVKDNSISTKEAVKIAMNKKK
jgi:hypothetical protein